MMPDSMVQKLKTKYQNVIFLFLYYNYLLVCVRISMGKQQNELEEMVSETVK